MRKLSLLLGSSLVLAASAAGAADFQPIGSALGMGGAGVARTYNAYAPYYNPAGLAFKELAFSSRLNGGAGLRINSTMTESVDRLGKLDVNELAELNLSGANSASQNLALVSKATQFVGVLNDLGRHDGTLTVNANAVLGFQYQNFAIGGFSTIELASLTATETTRVALGGVASVADLATAIGAATATPGTFFTATQRNEIAAAFSNNAGVANAIDKHFTDNRPVTNQTPEQLKDALVRIGAAMTNSTGSLENNQSTLEYKGLITTDVPISYGHPIKLGSLGTLGVGASLKVIWGRAFIGESQIVKVKDSGDIVKNITDHYRDTTTFGIDLGALWRYSDWLNVGVVAKNLNAPEFDSPVVASIQGTTLKETFRLKPQVRTGISVDPLSWLTVAADLDLTRNDTILFGKQSQYFGGGVDIHPLTWLKLRGGVYKNLAAGEIGVVPTFGLTIGSKWVNLELDGAMALENGRFEDKEYPREARAQFSLNVQF